MIRIILACRGTGGDGSTVPPVRWLIIHYHLFTVHYGTASYLVVVVILYIFISDVIIIKYCSAPVLPAPRLEQNL